MLPQGDSRRYRKAERYTRYDREQALVNMVWHEAQMHKQSALLQRVRVRRLGKLFKFLLMGYGKRILRWSYARQNKRIWRLHPGKLPVG